MINPNDGTADALARAVAGQFSIEREIGRGGIGVVYLARDEQSHRSVAIKTLPPHLSYDPQVRARFLREARARGPENGGRHRPDHPAAPCSRSKPCSVPSRPR